MNTDTPTERSFKGIWIPKEIWLDERLGPIDKIVLMEIDSLDCGELGCYASNEWLANRCQCSQWKISEAITKLKKLGMIKLISFDGRFRSLRSCLGNIQTQPLENHEAESGNSKDSNKGSNKGSNRENITPLSPSETDADFERFYELYPKKKAKQSAINAWKKLKPSKELVETIIADVQMKRETEWCKKERYQFIPYPGTYLNGRRWEDESEATEIAKPTRPAEVQLTDEERAIIDRINAEGLNYG